MELRNPEWFTNSEVWGNYTSLLEKYKIANTIVDTPGRRDMMHMRLTTPIAFIRWVGCNKDDIDYKRLDEWIVRIKKWETEGLKKVYFFVHQGNETSSPVFSAYFITKLNTALGIDLKVPEIAEGGQSSLF